MANLYRFGISLEKNLIDLFDKHIQKKGYSNRSEAIRDLIRDELVRDEWLKDKIVAGTITMIYDHHKRDLVNKLINIQHDYLKIILSNQHIHLDHEHCLEIIAVKGKAKDVRELSDKIKILIGVKHLALSMSTTGTEIQ